MGADNVSKAKITTSLGEFEFEGSQAYVEAQVDRIIALSEPKPTKGVSSPARGASKKIAKAAAAVPKKNVQASPKMMNDLVPKAKITELKEFVELKKPKGHLQTYAVLGYFLKDSLGKDDFGVDEMWSLYKVLKLRPQRVPMQAFRDAKSRHSYVDHVADGRYFLTSIGETFVEHDLPAATAGK
jgi:hypothetical protein